MNGGSRDNTELLTSPDKEAYIVFFAYCNHIAEHT